jgi:hypothetical protein
VTNNTIYEISLTLNVIKNVTEPIRKNRNHKRIKKRPLSKWGSKGNKFNTFHK